MVNTLSSDYCMRESRPCIEGNGYSPSHSSSKTLLKLHFSLRYGGGTELKGDYYTDVIHFAAHGLPNVPFGLVNEVDTHSEDTFSHGVFGIGYATQQSDVLQKHNYPLIFDLLIEKGWINTAAYSLWQDAGSSGHILIGGVDRAKYIGNLATVPIISKDLFIVTLGKLGFLLGTKQ